MKNSMRRLIEFAYSTLSKMGYLPRKKVPKYLKFGSKHFNLSNYINLTENTDTCKTGGFFYSVEDDWLSLTVEIDYYEDNVLGYIPDNDAYIYSDKYSMYSVEIKQKNYIRISEVVPDKRYSDKILLIETVKDAELFQEMFVNPELDVMYQGEKTEDCHVNWKKVREKFGGFETWITKYDFESWASFWHIRSGVIWNFGLINRLDKLEFTTPKIPKTSTWKFWTTSGSNKLGLSSFINDSGLEFYKDVVVSDRHLFISKLDLDEDKILVVDSMPKITKKLKGEYSGVFNQKMQRGILWDASAIKDVITKMIN